MSFLCTWESSGHRGKAPRWLFLRGPPMARLCPHLVAVQLDPDATQLPLPTSLPPADSHSVVPLDSSGACHTPKSRGRCPSRWAGGAREVSSPPFHHLGKVSSHSTLITLQIKVPQYSTLPRVLQHLMCWEKGTWRGQPRIAEQVFGYLLICPSTYLDTENVLGPELEIELERAPF